MYFGNPHVNAMCVAHTFAHSFALYVAKFWLGEEGNSVQKDAPSVCGRRKGADVPARQA